MNSKSGGPEVPMHECS